MNKKKKKNGIIIATDKILYCGVTWECKCKCKSEYKKKSAELFDNTYKCMSGVEHWMPQCCRNTWPASTSITFRDKFYIYFSSFSFKSCFLLHRKIEISAKFSIWMLKLKLRWWYFWTTDTRSSETNSPLLRHILSLTKHQVFVKTHSNTQICAVQREAITIGPLESLFASVLPQHHTVIAGGAVYVNLYLNFFGRISSPATAEWMCCCLGSQHASTYCISISIQPVLIDIGIVKYTFICIDDI